jgi:hypothetical protein
MPSGYEGKLEALIQRKVQQAVAPWRELCPPHHIDTLTRIADDYYRHNPIAVEVLDAMVKADMVQASGSFSRRDIRGVEGLETGKKGANDA